MARRLLKNLADQTIGPQRKALRIYRFPPSHAPAELANSVPVPFSFQERVVSMAACILVVVVVVVVAGRGRAAEHAPVAREVDEGQRERAHEAGGAGQGDGLLDGVARAAEEEPVRYDRAHRAAARRHPGHHAQRPACTKPTNPRRKGYNDPAKSKVTFQVTAFLQKRTTTKGTGLRPDLSSLLLKIT